MGYYMVLVVFFFQILHVFCCPDTCSCFNGRFECYGKGFLAIPEPNDDDPHTIILSYNKIRTLKPLSFYGYQKLNHLELQNNVISTIHNQTFHGLQNLTYLDLSNNQLFNINPEVFKPLAGLQTLNLGNNRLASLSGDILAGLADLTTLYLHNNLISNLRPDVLSNLSSLTHLRLDGNPWVCSCQIQNILAWMLHNEQKIEEKSRTLCEVPRYLEQCPVMDVQSGSFLHCNDSSTPYDHLYILLIGISLFVSSILLCLVTGSLIVSYERLLVQMKKTPTMYKKKREERVNGHHIPVCHI
ncbi:leucine-rich repeat-containing protein 26 [Discoglossus pictus]